MLHLAAMFPAKTWTDPFPKGRLDMVDPGEAPGILTVGC